MSDSADSARWLDSAEGGDLCPRSGNLRHVRRKFTPLGSVAYACLPVLTGRKDETDMLLESHKPENTSRISSLRCALDSAGAKRQ